MRLRALLFYTIISIYTIVIGFLGLPLLLTFKQHVVNKVGVIWSLGAIKLLKIVCNLNYKVEGVENIPSSNVIVAAKHSTAWETMFLLYFMHPSSFILKKELTRIPIYGWYLPLLGMIPIARTQKIQSIKKIITQSKDRLARGFNVVIFPEGSRSAKSVSVKSGIYSIHKNLKNYSVLPITHNASEYFGGKGSFSIKPGVITVKIKPPLSFDPNKQGYLNKIQQSIRY